MWTNGPCGWFPMMWIFPLVFLVVIMIFLFGRGGRTMCGGREMRDRSDSAKEILDRRYASGEISEDEYQRMKKNLG